MKIFGQTISTNRKNEIAASDGVDSFLYQLNGQQWEFIKSFSGGSDVSLSDDGSKIATCNDGLNLATIYTKTSGGWTEETITLNENGFGSKVKISGDGKFLCVKSRQDIKVYQYKDNQWHLIQENFIPKNSKIQGKTVDRELRDFDISDDGSKIILSHEWVMPEADTLDDDEWSTLQGFNVNNEQNLNNLIEVWDTDGKNEYEKVFETEGYSCKISGDGSRILIGNSAGKYIEVRERAGTKWFEQIGDRIFSRVSGFGEHISMDYYGNVISVYEHFSRGRVKMYNYNNQNWSSIGRPVHFGANFQLLKSGEGIVFYTNSRSSGQSLRIFKLKRKSMFFKNNQDLDFGDLDWRDREAYSLDYFLNLDQHFDLSNTLYDILPTDLPTELDYDMGSEHRGYSWHVDYRYSEYDSTANHYILADDEMSPYGSLIGNYEFVNIFNINKWKNETIKRHTKNSQYFYEDCVGPRSTYSKGRCRPTWPEDQNYRSSDPSKIDINNLYGGDSIIGANLDSRGDQYDDLKFDTSNYQFLGYGGSSSYFKDNVANRFWSNFKNHILSSPDFMAVNYLRDNLNREYLAVAHWNNNAATASLDDMTIDGYRLTESLVDFIKKRFNSESLPYSFNPNNFSKLGRSSSCGGSVPYVGYNEDGHIIERELVCLPVKRITKIAKENHEETQEQKYLFVFVQWSVTYVYPPKDKITPLAFRRLYNINENFSYRGSVYDVYDNFPFQDFHMNPIRWNKSVK